MSIQIMTSVKTQNSREKQNTLCITVEQLIKKKGVKEQVINSYLN